MAGTAGCVTRWKANRPATESMLRGLLAAEGLSAYAWSNAPLDQYAAHQHEYDKVIYVVSGSIRFGLREEGEEIELGPGDRLDLPKGMVHSAVVGGQGVVCLEAHKE